MAIKGKKKSGTRGSQARRRPSSAPRPAVTARAREPWHRTATGRVAAALVVLLLFGVVAAVLAAQAADRDRLAARQERLDTFTDRFRALMEGLRSPAGGMAAAPAAVDAPGVEELADDSEQWLTDLGGAQGQMARLPVVPGTETAQDVLGQAIAAYMSAAKAYGLVPSLGEEQRGQQLLVASEARNVGSSLLSTAITELDRVREASDLEASGIPVPGSDAPAPQPPPDATTPPGDGGGDDGGREGERERDDRGGRERQRDDRGGRDRDRRDDGGGGDG